MEKIRAAQVSIKALKTRKKYLGGEHHLPICPYSLCEAMGLDLRFIKIPSFEGMYVAEQNLILISSDRPEGRKRFTCGHEIGHNVLGHGTVIDEILECGSNKQEEEEADFFSSVLLMPSSSVIRILRRYGVSAERINPVDAYTLSKYFGVSYQAFITHISNNLRLITYKQYQFLRKAELKDIRKLLCDSNTNNQVFKVGDWWDEKAIEVEVGDIIVSDSEVSIDGPNIIESVFKNESPTYKAIKPGITRVFQNDWSCFIKVSTYKYQGLYQYKYDEDDE